MGFLITRPYILPSTELCEMASKLYIKYIPVGASRCEDI